MYVHLFICLSMNSDKLKVFKIFPETSKIIDYCNGKKPLNSVVDSTQNDQTAAILNFFIIYYDYLCS